MFEGMPGGHQNRSRINFRRKDSCGAKKNFLPSQKDGALGGALESGQIISSATNLPSARTSPSSRTTSSSSSSTSTSSSKGSNRRNKTEPESPKTTQKRQKIVENQLPYDKSAVEVVFLF